MHFFIKRPVQNVRANLIFSRRKCLCSLGTLRNFLGRGVNVVKDDGAVVALDKPAGVKSHPNAPNETFRTLLRGSYNFNNECYHLHSPGSEANYSDSTSDHMNTTNNSKDRAWLLHRLDSATSGLILVTTHFEVAEAIKLSFSKREVEKVYYAVVFNENTDDCFNKDFFWRDPIVVNRNGNSLRTSAGGSVTAITRVRVVRTKMIMQRLQLMLLELKPLTGFTHQLRFQCSIHKMPIVNDNIYGDFQLNKFAKEFVKRQSNHNLPSTRMYLHAQKLELRYKLGENFGYFAAESVLPSEFGDVFDVLGRK